MMRWLTVLVLEVSLLLSTILAWAYLVRIAASYVLPVDWFWAGALAVFVSPVCLAGALWLLEHGRPSTVARTD